MREKAINADRPTHPRLPLVPVELYPNMHALTIEVIERRYDGLHDFGLDMVL